MIKLCTWGAGLIHKLTKNTLYVTMGLAPARTLLFCSLISITVSALAQTTQTQTTTAQDFNDYTIQASTQPGFTQTALPAHWKDKKRILTITAPYVDLHTFAGRGYPIFHVIEKNDVVYLYKRRNDWFKVETQDGKIGWVARHDMDHTVNQNNARLNFGNKGWQDHQNNRYEIGVTTGSLDGAIAYASYLGYHFTPNIQLELNYTQAFGNYSNLKLASLSVIHKPFPDWRVTPFIKLSSGVIQTNPSTIIVQPVDRQDPLLTVGGGLFFYPSNRLVLRVEYDKHTILTTRDVNEEVEEWKAGFGVLF